MRLRPLCLTLACVLAGAGSTAGAAPSTAIETLAALPAEIRAALGVDVSDRGGPFAAGCVSLHGEPHSRFHEASMSGDTARVTLERGGIAHFYDELEFRKIDGHWTALPHAIPHAPPAPPARSRAAAPSESSEPDPALARRELEPDVLGGHLRAPVRDRVAEAVQ